MLTIGDTITRGARSLRVVRFDIAAVEPLRLVAMCRPTDEHDGPLVECQIEEPAELTPALAAKPSKGR